MSGHKDRKRSHGHSCDHIPSEVENQQKTIHKQLISKHLYYHPLFSYGVKGHMVTAVTVTIFMNRKKMLETVYGPIPP